MKPICECHVNQISRLINNVVSLILAIPYKIRLPARVTAFLSTEFIPHPSNTLPYIVAFLLGALAMYIFVQQ